MRISSRCEYGVRAMVHLAARTTTSSLFRSRPSPPAKAYRRRFWSASWRGYATVVSCSRREGWRRVSAGSRGIRDLGGRCRAGAGRPAEPGRLSAEGGGCDRAEGLCFARRCGGGSTMRSAARWARSPSKTCERRQGEDESDVLRPCGDDGRRRARPGAMMPYFSERYGNASELHASARRRARPSTGSPAGRGRAGRQREGDHLHQRRHGRRQHGADRLPAAL